MENSVLFTFTLRANVYTPGLATDTDGFEILHVEDRTIRFVPNRANSLRDMKETLSGDLENSPVGSKEERHMRKVVDHLRQVMIVPSVEVEFNGVRLSTEEMPSESGFLEATVEKLSKSTWALLLKEAIASYNSLIRSLYLQQHSSRVLSSIFYPSGDIAADLNECKAKIRRSEGPILNVRFNALVTQPLNSIGEVTLDKREIDKLRSEGLTDTANDPIWDYLESAEQRFNDGNYRHAVIDLDIAAGIAVRRRLMEILALPELTFYSLSKNSSTGELIKSLALVSSQGHDNPIAELSSLHSTRNTILHQNQRRVGKETVSHYEVVRDWILRILIRDDVRKADG